MKNSHGVSLARQPLPASCVIVTSNPYLQQSCVCECVCVSVCVCVSE